MNETGVSVVEQKIGKIGARYLSKSEAFALLLITAFALSCDNNIADVPEEESAETTQIDTTGRNTTPEETVETEDLGSINLQTDTTGNSNNGVEPGLNEYDDVPSNPNLGGDAKNLADGMSGADRYKLREKMADLVFVLRGGKGYDGGNTGLSVNNVIDIEGTGEVKYSLNEMQETKGKGKSRHQLYTGSITMRLIKPKGKGIQIYDNNGHTRVLNPSLDQPLKINYVIRGPHQGHADTKVTSNFLAPGRRGIIEIENLRKDVLTSIGQFTNF